MVKAVFYKKDDDFYGFSVKGHAEFDEIGKDIVCSAISAIVIGGLNALKNIEYFKISIESGDVECIAHKLPNNHDKIVIETIRIQLESIRKDHQKKLSIIDERME